MRRLKICIIATVTLLVSLACERTEMPVLPYERGEAETISLSTGDRYSDVIWFNLKDFKVVKTANKYTWDFAFSCDKNSTEIYLNSAVAMQASATGKVDFGAVNSTTPTTFRADHNTGNPDSLALLNAAETNEVFVIDLGIDAAGQFRKKIKFQCVSATASRFSIKIGELNDTNAETIAINKEDGYNTIVYNIMSKEQFAFEPKSTEWDIVFTSYMYQFYDPFVGYLVNGVLLNPLQTEAFMVDTLAFDSIDTQTTMSGSFSSNQDAIGYEWKYYDFDTGLYVLNTQNVYVIKDQNGYFYALQFVDYYAANGSSGHPTFKIRRL